MTPPALSVRQPWAALLLDGRKPVENRTWSTRHRGPLVIHAGHTPDRDAAPVLRHRFGITTVHRADERGYLGVVELVDVHHSGTCRDRCSRWAAPGHWHWMLTRPRRLATPLPGPGRLGLYPPPPDITGRLHAAGLLPAGG
jgi:ASCH domain